MKTKRVLINKEQKQIYKKGDVETRRIRQKSSFIGNTIVNRD